MAENTRGMLLRKRNILVAALVAGIGLGVYFGSWKGFGWGGGAGSEIGGGDGETHVSVGSEKLIKNPSTRTAVQNQDDASIPVPDVVRVLIDDREFLLRSANDDSRDAKISLPKLIQLIEQAPGDADGLRVRIYRKTTARASAEESLKDKLTAAGIEDAAVFWVPNPVK
jgi:hypothetical protein